MVFLHVDSKIDRALDQTFRRRTSHFVVSKICQGWRNICNVCLWKFNILTVSANNSFSGSEVSESLLFVVQKFNVRWTPSSVGSFSHHSTRLRLISLLLRLIRHTLWGKESAEHPLLRPTGAGYSSFLRETCHQSNWDNIVCLEFEDATNLYIHSINQLNCCTFWQEPLEIND